MIVVTVEVPLSIEHSQVLTEACKEAKVVLDSHIVHSTFYYFFKFSQKPAIGNGGVEFDEFLKMMEFSKINDDFDVW
jgi:hypothetical protein